MTVHEAYIGFQFIIAALRADSQWVSLSLGGVRRGAAPIDTPMPCTIIAFQSGMDVIYANAVRSSVNVLYQVKATGLADNSTDVFALAARIDDLLGGNQGVRHISVSSVGHILSCYRESLLAYDDNTAGIQYAHMGGLYRIRAQQVPS